MTSIAGVQRLTQFPGLARRRLIRVLEAPWTLRSGLLLFVLVAAGLAVAIHYPVVDGVGNVPYAGTIAPDEHRHIANILYYAHRSVFAGPIITDEPAQYLTMGEIERFPSYFYYYAMSFPVKVLVHLHAPYGVIVVLLRLANVLVASLGLIAVRRLLRVMGFSVSISVAVVLLLAFTGRYMWQAAAVSYDPPSTTLFFVCLLFCATLIRSPGSGVLVRAVVAGLGAVIMKYTFVPFVLVAIVLAVVLVAQRDGLAPFMRPLARLRVAFRHRRAQVIGRSALLALVVVIVAERLGINLLVYGQFNPSCTKLHSHVQCLAYDIYRRNFFAARTHDLSVVHGAVPPQFDFFQFAGSWLTSYFDSMFFYQGRTSQWSVNGFVEAAGILTFVAAMVVTVLSVRTLLRTRAFAWGVAVAATYVLAMFVFNVQTFVKLDQEYAFSARYLLPVLPLVYAFSLVSGITFWRSLSVGWRASLVVPATVVAVFVLVTYAAPVAFFAYATDPSWYTPFALRVLPHFITGGTA